MEKRETSNQVFLIDREFINGYEVGTMVRIDRKCEAYLWVCGRWCGVEEAGEEGGEGDGSWRLLQPLVGVGLELVFRWSDGWLLSYISAGLLKDYRYSSWELWLEATYVVGLGIELLAWEDCDVLGEETSSVLNLGIMGDQLCRCCSNHLGYCHCGEQVKLKVIP